MKIRIPGALHALPRLERWKGIFAILLMLAIMSFYLWFALTHLERLN